MQSLCRERRNCVSIADEKNYIVALGPKNYEVPWVGCEFTRFCILLDIGLYDSVWVWVYQSGYYVAPLILLIKALHFDRSPTFVLSLAIGGDDSMIPSSIILPYLDAPLLNIDDYLIAAVIDFFFF